MGTLEKFISLLCQGKPLNCSELKKNGMKHTEVVTLAEYTVAIRHILKNYEGSLDEKTEFCRLYAQWCMDAENPRHLRKLKKVAKKINYQESRLFRWQFLDFLPQVSFSEEIEEDELVKDVILILKAILKDQNKN